PVCTPPKNATRAMPVHPDFSAVSEVSVLTRAWLANEASQSGEGRYTRLKTNRGTGTEKRADASQREMQQIEDQPGKEAESRSLTVVKMSDGVPLGMTITAKSYTKVVHITTQGETNGKRNLL